MANKIEELEDTLLGQIGMLNDLSVMKEKESRELIERSKVIGSLADSFIEIQKTKIEAQKVKIDAVKVWHDTMTGIKGADNSVQKYLGIEAI